MTAGGVTDGTPLAGPQEALLLVAAQEALPPQPAPLQLQLQPEPVSVTDEGVPELQRLVGALSRVLVLSEPQDPVMLSAALQTALVPPSMPSHRQVVVVPSSDTGVTVPEMQLYITGPQEPLIGVPGTQIL